MSRSPYFQDVLEEVIHALHQTDQPQTLTALHALCPSSMDMSITREAVCELERTGYIVIVDKADNEYFALPATNATAGGSSLRCALWNDGSLALHGREGSLHLAPVETRALIEYLTTQGDHVDAIFGESL